MNLKISSPSGVLFQGEINSVTLPTEQGDLTIWQQHSPLITIIKPWLVRFVPIKQEKDFVHDQEKIVVSLAKGTALIDGKNIIVTTSTATRYPHDSHEMLQQMRNSLNSQIKRMRTEYNMQELEKVINQVEKINADLQLLQLQNR